ncbi:antibiotic biosynthesis monooxygenase [Acetobacteraceae bacterium]|nr:antibiotic biosynthesis monooxygenase [Acetobacteraceae bacterium]
MAAKAKVTQTSAQRAHKAENKGKDAPKSLYAVITALPGHEAEVSKLLDGMAKNVRAEKGCVRYEIYTLASDPKVFHVEESYKNDKAFQAHVSQEYGKKFNEAIKPIVKDGAAEVVFLTNQK